MEKVVLPRDVHSVQRKEASSWPYGALGPYGDPRNESDHDGVDHDRGEDDDEEEHGTVGDTILLEDDSSVTTTAPDTCIL